jgi:hypothetical protein
VVVLLVAVWQIGPAQAHSTKGRKKVPLKKEILGIDDIAYFAESYVHRHLYKNRFEKPERRFYVKEFIAVEQEGSRARIRFIVLDLKENTTFEDVMTIVRGLDGSWYYQPDRDAKRVELYTYVKKWAYYYKTYVVPGSVAGITLGLGSLGVLRARKRNKQTGGNT